VTMPKQLAMALQAAKRGRRRFRERPLFEELPSLDCRMLARRKIFPGNWHDVHRFEFGLIAPPIRELTLSRAAAELVLRGGTTQTIPIYWQRIGGMCEGTQRPMFVCGCGRNVFKLFRLQGAYQCKMCAVKRSAVYASQHGGPTSRARLQAARLRRFLGGNPENFGEPAKPPLMHRSSYRRLVATLRGLDRGNCAREWEPICRLARPLTRYRTQFCSRRY
jgi:hypothetical protein